MKRERITITIDTDLIPAVDQLIDKETIRNRSHALEYAVRRGLALQELQTIFFIHGEKIISPEQTVELFDVVQPFSLKSISSITTTAQSAAAQLWQHSFAQNFQQSPNQHILPAEFGTATALLLEKESISSLFLVINLDALTTLPKNLLPAFTFHLQQGALVTHLIHPEGSTFISSGISIVSKELLTFIPAGKADLTTDVFPLITKAGKVSTYVYSF